jgi:3-oxoacyl-[acyl-carrier protein] reductase
MSTKVVLITGGAAGIGRATANGFLADGYKVWIWDLNAIAIDVAVNHWKTQGFEVGYDVVDVSDYQAVESAVQRIADADGCIDVLVNNAGITMDRSLLKMDPASWQKVIDVNLTGVFNCSRVVAELMAGHGSGVILNASSVVGLYGNFGQTNYVATKAGVIGMTKTMARELGRKGIRVNAVAPGFIATEMVQKMPQEVIDGMISKTPAGRMGTPEDIANAYVFLASDKASFITGTVISVDGGITV